MTRRGFISTMNALAREDARRKRQWEAEQKRIERERQKQIREGERARMLSAKEEKQRYLETRMAQVEELNTEIAEQIETLQRILEHTLNVNDRIDFESLRIKKPYKGMTLPQVLTTAKEPSTKHDFIAKVKPLGFLENALGLKGRYQREMQAAEAQFEAAMKAHAAAEEERKAKLASLQAQNEEGKRTYVLKANQRNQEVDELETAYQSGDSAAVSTYNSMVLERSEYPEGFPQFFRLAYVTDSKELVLEYELPGVEIIPTVAEYRYIKTKDVIDEKPRKASEIKELYQDVVASLALRTIHEVLEADQGNHLQTVVFNGYVQTIDPATGKDIRPHLVSVRATRGKFSEINLARVDKRACLRNLGAQVSAQPQAMQAVKPIVEFNMVDKRFVEQGDVLSDLESRPNLMDLNPTQFEVLVGNLFQRMGLESKLTRASRDGGVDAVAYDLRPVLGGKVVIQAKRYRHTVGVSAIRDLYGTMLNEGANKGIIVATSGYGPDAYEFAKDKPIELIDGGGLLYLLDQVGIQARIVFPEGV
jgi:restriction system protein